MKVSSWIIALLGLWEFADILALFVPGFGKIQPFLWSHIIVGMILMIVGAQAALTSDAVTAKTMHWIAAAASLWLIIGSFILRNASISAGLWNDIVVGVIALILSVRTALALPR